MKVEILIPDITRLATKTKCDEGAMITTIQFETKISPANIARVLNLGRQGIPLLVTISSPQAYMDLIIDEYKSEAEFKTTELNIFGMEEK